jgi:hypothetical protein
LELVPTAKTPQPQAQASAVCEVGKTGAAKANVKASAGSRRPPNEIEDIGDSSLKCENDRRRTGRQRLRSFERQAESGGARGCALLRNAGCGTEIVAAAAKATWRSARIGAVTAALGGAKPPMA